MNLSQALKLKNRIAGELVRQQQILQRENSRRSDNVSTIECDTVWQKVIDLSNLLGVLKGKITKANVNIYPALERMAELKSRISLITGLDKREGPEVNYVGRDQEKVEYTWTSFINQSKADEMVSELQLEINALQDEVDTYNAETQIAD